jgi:excisionase family DNA binding protein
MSLLIPTLAVLALAASPLITKPRQTPDPAELWSRERAAAYMGASQSTFDRQMKSGKIPHYKIGNRVLFDPADLSSLVASGYRPASKG